jgi:hypothetical protein
MAGFLLIHTRVQSSRYPIQNLSLQLRANLRQIALLLLLTAAAIFVHGYHPYVEDAEIYVPGVKKALNPALYPANTDFFLSHAKMTIFPHLIAGSVRVIHIPLNAALFLWQFAAIFFFLWACWRIGQLAFRDSLAAWGGAALVASLLTIPVAGTALYIMDQYLTTRALSTPATVWVIVNTIERKWVRAGLWLLFTGLIHPLMVVFCLAYVTLLLWLDRTPSPSTRPRFAAVAAFLFPLGMFPRITEAYREILETRSYFFLLRWEWYEWLGIFAPLVLLEWFRRLARKRELPVLARLCGSTIIFGLLFFVSALIVSVPPQLANLAELQPMRCLQLVYVLLFVVAGGFLAQFVLQRFVWRWLLLFAPICAGMFHAQRQLFPATAHLELPGIQSSNPWVQAFLWVRDHTPTDAYFALDPNYMRAPAEDEHGFRALAERSRMADRLKDSGVVSMFPKLAGTWRDQVRSLDGWQNFKAPDFERLRRDYGVTWVILQNGASRITDGAAGVPPAGRARTPVSPLTATGPQCPFENSKVLVCRLDQGVASR